MTSDGLTVVPWNTFYAVKKDGTVWCIRTRGGKLLDNWHKMALVPVPPDGRLVVGLRDHRLTRWYVHALILTVFVGPCPDGLEGCHYDGNVANNNLENLRWDTHLANIEDRARHGRTIRGQRMYSAKLKESQVREIRERCASGELQKHVAVDYGVNASCVQKIVSRYSWGWLT